MISPPKKNYISLILFRSKNKKIEQKNQSYCADASSIKSKKNELIHKE